MYICKANRIGYGGLPYSVLVRKPGGQPSLATVVRTMIDARSWLRWSMLMMTPYGTRMADPEKNFFPKKFRGPAGPRKKLFPKKFSGVRPDPKKNFGVRPDPEIFPIF